MYDNGQGELRWDIEADNKLAGTINYERGEIFLGENYYAADSSNVTYSYYDNKGLLICNDGTIELRGEIETHKFTPAMIDRLYEMLK